MIAIWIGKFVIWVLQQFNRQGTSLPGKLALRVNPRVLAQMARQLTECTIVTGTNGKTTTANILAGILHESGPLIHNREGSNMLQGITSVLIANTDWLGRLRIQRALLEVDEASLPLIAEQVPIHYAVLTNVFRDQLDRYGELDTTLSTLVAGLSKTRATVVFNADDPLSTYVAVATHLQTVGYGLADATDRPQSTPFDSQFPRDGAFCMTCGGRLEYDVYLYGQLGQYHCTTCEFKRPKPTYSGRYKGHELIVSEGFRPGLLQPVRSSYPLPVRGLFNAFNALAAIATARAIGVDRETVATGLSEFQPPVGRMQTFRTQPQIVLNLVKNPTGADNVLEAILDEPGRKVACIIINDNAADGRDVSWLWDTQFERFVSSHATVQWVVAAGSRAEDMALRLKYAGYPTTRIECETNVEQAIQGALDNARNRDCTVYVIATYTALAPAAAYIRTLEGADRNDQTPQVRTSLS